MAISKKDAKTFSLDRVGISELEYIYDFLGQVKGTKGARKTIGRILKAAGKTVKRDKKQKRAA